ncbi:hypothetical protein IEQ34_012828 [Dendrobium chrysotoxum]|uniref:Uncharacterized protein n=1 Tax=Dendrobium chrysotoxum TaxID=161865 RepID=A0AAV7GP74_DENCH|nr:hypothetical protein IEQ34_012828 [Dendrobium chrysotoxum]
MILVLSLLLFLFGSHSPTYGLISSLPRILYALGSLFGHPLKVDNATSIDSRPSLAHCDLVLISFDTSSLLRWRLSLPFVITIKSIVHVLGDCRTQSSVQVNVPIISSNPLKSVGNETGVLKNVVVDGNVGGVLPNPLLCHVLSINEVLINGGSGVESDLRGEEVGVACRPDPKAMASAPCVDVSGVDDSVLIPEVIEALDAVDHGSENLDVINSNLGGNEVDEGVSLAVGVNDSSCGLDASSVKPSLPTLYLSLVVLKGMVPIVDVPVSIISNENLKA